MKITVWGINYAPEVTGIGPYNTELCEFLAGQGHEVRMVTSFPYYPGWEKRPEDRGRLFARERSNGVEVVRCWHYVPKKPTALKRVMHEASFIATSLVRQLFLGRPDVFVIVSPPLPLGPAAWLLGLLQRRPFHFHVQDIQPEAALCVGLLKPGKLANLLYSIERFTYRRARSVSGITRGMLDLFRDKGAAPAKCHFLPNWSRESGGEPDRQVSFRDHWKIPENDFLVVYSGNLGKKQGLNVIVDAAEQLLDSSKDNGVTIVIAGDGGEKADLERAAARRPIPLRILPLQPGSLFHSMLTQADLCLVTQQPGSGALFFPSKILTILGHGRPVLCVADEESELHRAAREGQFGECVPPDQPETLAEAILRLRDQPEQLARYGEAGRQWVAGFSREEVLARFAMFLATGRVEESPAKPSPVGRGI